jgi:hypothetical protein
VRFSLGTGLPQRAVCVLFSAMSVLELKQEVSRMNKRDRQELYAYLVRLKHETPEWKKAAAKRVGEMEKGRFITTAGLKARLAGR